MKVETARAIMTFLERVTLRPAEINAFNIVVQEVMEVISPAKDGKQLAAAATLVKPAKAKKKKGLNDNGADANK